MIAAKIKTDKLDTTLRRWRANLVPAARRQALDAAGIVVDRAAVIAPKDTNKYVRGWIEAGRQVNVGTMPMPPIERSKYAESLLKELTIQKIRAEARLAKLQRTYAVWYGDTGRKPDRHSRLLQKQIATQGRRVQKAEELIYQLTVNPSATVIRRKFSYVLAGNEGRDDGTKGIDVEVRSKAYGGRGRVLTLGTTTRVQLDVLEPYSLSVERLRQVRAKAIAYARTRIRFRTGNARTFARLIGGGTI